MPKRFGTVSSCRSVVLTLVGLVLLLVPHLARSISLEEETHPIPAQIRDLPVIGQLGREPETRLVVRGKLRKARARSLFARIRAVRRDVGRRLGKSRDRAARPIQVCLFSRTAQYDAFVDGLFGPDSFQQDVGFFSPYHRVVAVDLARRPGALEHELVHALVIDLPGRWPYWAEEGLASLYVDARIQRGEVVFNNSHRLAALRAARKTGQLPSFHELVASDDRQVYGKGWRGYYALSRFALLFLERQGQLNGFLKSLRAAPFASPKQRQLLIRKVKPGKFWAWVDKL